MKRNEPNDPRTLEQILAGEPPPPPRPVPARRPIRPAWIWGGLAAIVWLYVFIRAPDAEDHAEAMRQRAASAEAAIARRQVFIGMTRDEVIAAWGSPRRSNVTLNAYGKHEQLVYESNYLYLTDGVLTSIQSMN